MLNTRDVCRNNEFIANDYYKGSINNTEYVRSSKKHYTKKELLSNQTKRINNAKYESKSNICSSCFTTKSVLTNECLCD